MFHSNSRGIPALALTLFVAACGDGGLGGNSDPLTEKPNVFLSIVPPGSNGNSAGGVGAPAGIPAEMTQYPDNYRDQLDMYGNLAYAQRGLKSDTCNPPADIGDHAVSSDQACNYFKRANITLTDAETVGTPVELDAPGGGTVTIRRDGWGVPYVDGENRLAAQFGLGYAAAQDRLWLFDLLRNVGRGRASEFLGPANDLFSQDIEFSTPAGYSEGEITAIVNNAVAKLNAISGSEKLGDVFLSDTQTFVAGMNAYIDFLQTPTGVLQIPLEYASLAAPAGLSTAPSKFPPRDFTVNDIVANAILIQSALGLGGGGESKNVKLLQTLDPALGPNSTSIAKAACELWRDLRHANAPDTTHSASGVFATQSGAVSEICPQALPAGVALWDKDSLVARAIVTHAESNPLLAVNAKTKKTRAATQLAAASKKIPAKQAQQVATSVRELLKAPDMMRTASNWIAVNGSQTKSGHPIMVAGPQTSYFNPQLLWEAAVISRGGTPLDIAARGISTVNLPYIVIGHGLDFAWSPTSAGSDFTDTRVSLMCNTNGSAASRNDANNDGFPDADGYLFKGQCQPFYRRLDTWTATPTGASFALGCTGTSPDNPGPLGENCFLSPRTVSRHILRTHYGPVTHTATVNGQPVAISTQRSTFMADVDTAAPFALLTTVGKPMTQQRYKQLFNSMTATFNWLYADKKDIGYIQSGLYPLRHPQHNPELPVWGDGRFEWQVDEGFNVLSFGGNAGTNPPATTTVRSWPSRAVPVLADPDPQVGYFEWPGFLPLSAHIQDTNPAQGFLANWNNSGAAGWWAADGNGTYGPTHRVNLLANRLKAFKASGRKHDLGSMIEVMGDAAYTDLRGLDLLPLLIQLMNTGTLTADQQSLVTLMQAWIDDGSQLWIDGKPGLGALRRDRDNNGTYDHRAAVVLMDAWYNRLMETVTVQLAELEADGASVLVGRLDAPRQQGSAFQEGWFQHMRRLLQTVLNTPGHAEYRGLKCAGTGTPADCRAAVLTALDQAVTDLGGIGDIANWDGTTIANRSGEPGEAVEEYDNVEHSNFGFLPLPAIHWINRPTFQQAVEISTDRSQQ